MNNAELHALGYSDEDIADLVGRIARAAAYQLVAHERGGTWQDYAHRAPADLLGDERWKRLATFTIGAASGLEMDVEIDDDGPVVREATLLRMGGIALAQFMVQPE